VSGLKYSLIADAYEKIESTRKRLEMTDHLVKLIKQTPKELLSKVAYLTQGKLHPDFEGIEIGMAERMVIMCLVKISGKKKEEVTKTWKIIGDLGTTADRLLSKQYTMKLITRLPLTVEKVYKTLDKIAHTSGKGTVGIKVGLLAALLIDATSKEARYLVRTVTGKLRLGIGDMTFLDALAIAYGEGKLSRVDVERAYNLSSDLGLVSETLANEGLEGIRDFRIRIGRPIRPMLCERLTTADEILKKLGGWGSAEFKYDGLRIQAHITSAGISLFSRRLENITSQFPDVIAALASSITVEEVIVEGECVAVDPNTDELLPFQVVTQRRGRKYEIKRMTEEVPVVLILFDALYIDGKSLIDFPYLKRRQTLKKIVRETNSIRMMHPLITDNSVELDTLIDTAAETGCEGLVIKAIGSNSVYQAGARGFLWIKYKREYRSEMADTVDLVVVGAFAGQGRRAGTYGALLMASYDEESDAFKTVCKLGTGFDDVTLARLPKMFEADRIDHMHPRVESKIEADFWFVPKKVLEIIGSELTLSPSHTCGLDILKKGVGFAIRFPRFSGKWRDDKASEDATTVKEIISMYRSQLKHV
jgi:DNA ligase-1